MGLGTTFVAVNGWGTCVEMQIIRCASSTCGRPFQLNQYQFSSEVSVPWKRGEIMCPHCGMLAVGDADSVFLTHALSQAQEAEFNRQSGNARNASARQDSPPYDGNGREQGFRR
ncbi:MAG TPA: hypothetical protein VGP12_02820 [Nitrosospira sp.]|nr:hypothetical protein [Nitrosospira sp.]